MQQAQPRVQEIVPGQHQSRWGRHHRHDNRRRGGHGQLAADAAAAGQPKGIGASLHGGRHREEALPAVGHRGGASGGRSDRGGIQTELQRLLPPESISPGQPERSRPLEPPLLHDRGLVGATHGGDGGAAEI